MWDRLMNRVEESPSVAISVVATLVLFGIEGFRIAVEVLS